MEHKFHSAGGAVEQLGQLGLSEMDLLKLAASGGLAQHGYNTRSHSAEVAHASQHPGMQSTFSPSWPPHGLGGGADRDASAAAALAAAHAGQHPLMPPGGGYFPSANLGGGAAGLGAHGALGGATDLSYLAQLGAVGGSAGLLSAAAQSAAFGEGPRIYVGGVPDLVTVAMVRDHFSRWGVVRDVHFPKERTSRRRRHFCFVTFESMQAAERAVAESNREIGGYPVAAINIPTDRLTHYGLRQASALASPTAGLRSGLPFGSGSPGALSNGMGPLGNGPSEAYASPTRVQSHSGIYGNVAHQVGAHRIRGTTSADFGHLAQLSQPEMSAAAHQLAGAPETDLAAALATLRLTQQQQQAAVAAANGYGSGSGSSTRQASQDFSVSRGSQDYGSQLGAGMLGMAMGNHGNGGLNAAATAANPAAGSDIYTVLANMQRNSLSAQHQQRHSPQPGAHMNLLQGGSMSAGGTPLGTPPGNGFHSTAGLPRTGSAQGTQHAPQQQQQAPPASSSFSFLGQGQPQQQQMLQQQENGMPHQRSSSFSSASGGLPPHPDFTSTRSQSAVMARSASPLARISSGVPGLSGLPTDMRSIAAYHTGSPAPSASAAGVPAPAGGLPGAGMLQQDGQQHFGMGAAHDRYMASSLGQQPTQQDSPQHGGPQAPASLPNTSRPPSGYAGMDGPGASQGGARASLDNSALDGDMHHLRGGAASNRAGAFGTSNVNPEPQHSNASPADVANRFASAQPRSQQQQQQQGGQQGPGHTEEAGEGSAHGPPLNASKHGQEASGNTDDSGSLDAKMSASVADLLRGSSGSLTHMLHHHQAQQFQGHQPQEHHLNGAARQPWDPTDAGRVQQQHPPQPQPRT